MSYSATADDGTVQQFITEPAARAFLVERNGGLLSYRQQEVYRILHLKCGRRMMFVMQDATGYKAIGTDTK